MDARAAAMNCQSPCASRGNGTASFCAYGRTDCALPSFLDIMVMVSIFVVRLVLEAGALALIMLARIGRAVFTKRKPLFSH